MTELKIGVIGIQGDVQENIIATSLALKRCNQPGRAYSATSEKKISQADGLIIPGGESTTIGKLLKTGNLFDTVKDKITSGTPVFGICAGLVLLSKQAKDSTLGDVQQPLFGQLNVNIKRNAFGRQQNSFEKNIDMSKIGIVNFNAIFIRAPIVTDAESNIEVLGKVDEKIVAVKQDKIIATAFHPELGTDTSIHEYFIKMINSN